MRLYASEAWYRGRKIGTIGDITDLQAFTLQKTWSPAEGGMLVTNRKNVANEVRVKSLHGLSRDACETVFGRRISTV
jgi:dTDP-4-amino-4,6-dideoxygalactose transaminase